MFKALPLARACGEQPGADWVNDLSRLCDFELKLRKKVGGSGDPRDRYKNIY
jgi:hypothetical protein